MTSTALPAASASSAARDLDFLRDEESAPLEYDDTRHGFRLTDETYTLSPVRISRKEAFIPRPRDLPASCWSTTRLRRCTSIPPRRDSVLDKIAESLEGDITIELTQCHEI